MTIRVGTSAPLEMYSLISAANSDPDDFSARRRSPVERWGRFLSFASLTQ